MREIREHSQRQRMARAAQRGRRVATPGIPLPQTSTLRSRRHLANMLIGSAIIFIACWAPHVFCVLYKIMGYKEYCKKSSRYFNLLLGNYYTKLIFLYIITFYFFYRLHVFSIKSYYLLGPQSQ